MTVDEVGRHMVNGRLAMTRSIGDLHLKKAGVTAFPDTRSLEVSEVIQRSRKMPSLFSGEETVS